MVSNPSKSNIITIECDFIKNSDAHGCMVVLEGEVDSQQFNLTRTNQSSLGVFVLTHPLSCYKEVFGFDIESDGSVGTLSIPGVLLKNVSNTCMSMNMQNSSKFLDMTCMAFQTFIIHLFIQEIYRNR